MSGTKVTSPIITSISRLDELFNDDWNNLYEPLTKADINFSGNSDSGSSIANAYTEAFVKKILEWEKFSDSSDGELYEEMD